MAKVTLESYWNASLNNYRAILGNIDSQLFDKNQLQMIRENPGKYDNIIRNTYRIRLTEDYLKNGQFDKLTTAIVRSETFEFLKSLDDLNYIIDNIANKLK